MDTDAGDFGIAGNLSQMQNGEEKVICYGALALNPAQQRYCAAKRELLALRVFLKKFRG